MIAPTKRQLEILDYILEYCRTYNCSPSIRDIGKHFHISPKGTHDHIRAMSRKGLITYRQNCSRSIRVMGDSIMQEHFDQVAVPFLGHVAAGEPVFAEENPDGMIHIPRILVGNGTFFALRVEGESMKDASITHGDIAIIRQQEVAENGQIIVAIIEDEAYTLKRFYKEPNRIRLQPENPNFGPMYSRNVRILGLLATLIRKY